MLIDFRNLFPQWDIKPKGILHLGSNVAEEAPVYAELGIENVIWIEGNPDLIPKLSENVGKYKGNVWYNYLVGDEHDKPVNFHIANNGGQSSSVLELGTHLQQHPEVHYIKDIPMVTKRIDKIFEGGFPFEVDFLNCDLQGFEAQALRGMGDLLNQFKWAYLEVNKADVYKGCEQVDSIDLFMISRGFRPIETRWVGNWGDRAYTK